MNSSSRHNKAVLILLGLSSLIVPIAAFLPNKVKHHNWKLGDVIQGEEVDAEPFDVGSGGVRLVQENAIKITGDVKHKPGSADARPMELLRYNLLSQVDESFVNDMLDKVGSKIVCSGQGKEFYKDPGETLEKTVNYGPTEAIKDAVGRASSAIECEKLVFNFLGGDDLMMGEVLDAIKEMVITMDIATKAKLSFNSLCHSSIPAGTCAVTVVSVGSSDFDGKDGVEKAVASGEVYSKGDGSWHTVSEAEINTALA
jgi:hypothetical protein